MTFIPQMDNTDIDPEILSAEYDDDNSAQIVYSNSAMGKNELPIHRYVFEVTSSTTSEDFIHIFKTWSLINNGNSDSDIVSTNLYSYDQGMKFSEESKWQKKEEEKSTRKGEGNPLRRYEFHIYFMMESLIAEEKTILRHKNDDDLNNNNNDNHHKKKSHRGTDLFYDFSAFQRILSLPGNIVFKLVSKKYGKGSYLFFDEENNLGGKYNVNMKENVRINLLNLFLKATSSIQVSNLNFFYSKNHFHTRQALLYSVHESIFIQNCTFSYLSPPDVEVFKEVKSNKKDPSTNYHNHEDSYFYSDSAVGEFIGDDNHIGRTGIVSSRVNVTSQLDLEEVISAPSDLQNEKLTAVFLDYYGNENENKKLNLGKQTSIDEEFEINEDDKGEEDESFRSKSYDHISSVESAKIPALFRAKKDIEISKSMFDSLSTIDGGKRKTLFYSEEGDVNLMGSEIQNHELVSRTERHYYYTVLVDQEQEEEEDLYIDKMNGKRDVVKNDKEERQSRSKLEKILDNKEINYLIKGSKDVSLVETILQNNMHYHYDTKIVHEYVDSILNDDQNWKMLLSIGPTKNLTVLSNTGDNIIQNYYNDDDPVSFINVPLSKDREKFQEKGNERFETADTTRKMQQKVESEILIQNSLFYANKIIRVSTLDVNQDITESAMKENNVVNIKFDIQEEKNSEEEMKTEERNNNKCIENFITGNIFAFFNNFTSNNIKIETEYGNSTYPSRNVEENFTTIKDELFCGFVTEFENIIT